jgi:uncharacterized membrane protein YtjA (UPF0391 family)
MNHQQKELCMLNYIVTFFILAIVAAVLGFGGLAASFAGVAKILTFVFLVLFVASLVYTLLTGRRSEPPVL